MSSLRPEPAGSCHMIAAHQSNQLCLGNSPSGAGMLATSLAQYGQNLTILFFVCLQINTWNSKKKKKQFYTIKYGKNVMLGNVKYIILFLYRVSSKLLYWSRDCMQKQLRLQFIVHIWSRNNQSRILYKGTSLAMPGKRSSGMTNFSLFRFVLF